MKRVLLFLLILLAGSCTDKVKDKEEIRQLARDNYVDDFFPINWLLQGYRNAYYAFPADYDEVLAYVVDCKEHEPFLSEVERIDERPGGQDIVDLLSRTKVFYASFGDSVFFYLPDYQVGSCVIGTPFYWLEHPEEYDRLDFEGLFQSAAYDENGSYLFSDRFDYERLGRLNDSIASCYDYVVTSEEFRYDGLSDEPLKRQMPYWSIVAFTSEGDSFEILSRVKSTDSLYVGNRPCTDNLPVCCKEYLDDLQAIIRTAFSENPDAVRIVTGIHWYLGKV